MTLPDPRADLSLREGYHSPQVEVEVRLNTNESPFPPPPGWLDQLCDEARSVEFNHYPDRSCSHLRVAIADFHQVSPDQVFVANGSNEVLQSVCLAYGGPGHEALTFEPTYALHSHIAHLTSTGVVQLQRDEGFALGLDEALEVTRSRRPAITFVCSPNNPTGLVEPPEVVNALLETSNGLIVVDEAYGQFARWSALELVREDVPLVVTRTFSKTWSMAALRLGYLIGPTEIVRALERVALPYHVDALKQAGGRLALRWVSEMEDRVQVIISERERLSAALLSLGVRVWPSESNFVLWRVEGRKGEEIWKSLVERSVLVRDVSTWPRLEGCLRTTIGTSEENDRFLAALRDVLS